MITVHRQKRKMAFILWGLVFVGFIVLLCALALLPQPIRPSKQTFTLLAQGALVIPVFFWFKGFFHWAKGKGYPGALAVIGVLGLPIAPLVMAALNDRTVSTTQAADPVEKCPNCGVEYRLSDYNPDATVIFCSTCKAQLPRN